MGEIKKPWQHFDERSANWSQLYQRPEFRDRLNLFIDSVVSRIPPGAKILDYGCGTGVISIELANRGYQVHGMDAAEGMVEQAKMNQEQAAIDEAIFSHIDPDNLQLSAELYDAVVCSSVIEYVENDKKLVENLCASLKPGGWIFVTIPHDKSILAKLEDLIKSCSKFGAARDVSYCQRRYNLKYFKKNLGKNDMRHFDTTYFEVPRLGQFGVALSRMRWIGLMLMVRAQKIKYDTSQETL